MGKIKGWKKIVDDEWIATGGGFNYFITHYRNDKDSRKQIEIMQESVPQIGKPKRIQATGMNIGIMPEPNMNKYESIQGDYIFVKEFKNLKMAKKFAHIFMKQHPDGDF